MFLKHKASQRIRPRLTGRDDCASVSGKAAELRMKLLTIVAFSVMAMQGAAWSAPLPDGFHQAKVTELSAQQRKRPRVIVRPSQPAAYDYPRPGYYSWPGPNAVRQCVDWYATEYRPSGAVITPQMRCRWVPG
jgi:hypothetical protein